MMHEGIAGEQHMSQSLNGAWQLAKLKEICEEITVGFVGSMAKEYVSDGIPMLRSKNIEPFRLNLDDLKFITPQFHRKIKKSALTPGDVVVVRTGYPGTACVIPPSLPVANCADLVIFRPSKALDSYFLASVFNSAWGKETVLGRLVGVAQQHFNVTVAKEMVISLPSLGTQRRIAAVLSAYDDLIENNTQRIAALEAAAQALYREWFVEFRFPGNESVAWVESELGPLPAGWEITTLGKACEITMGQSPSSDYYNDRKEGLPFHQGVTDFGVLFPTHRKYCTFPGRFAEIGDVLFSVRAPVGRINVADTKMIIGRGLSAIRNRQGQQAFTLCQLKERFQEEDVIGGGTIFKSVTKTDMYNIEFLRPSDTTAGEFEATARPIIDQMGNLLCRNAVLREARDLLLPRLISGQLSVSTLPFGEQL
jgi:type I restriction enzyme S subunit